MAASFLPTILVPVVGLVFPAITMAALFLYIERGQASTNDNSASSASTFGQIAEDSQTEVV
ncbi:MAG: photosystem I reaction center subunit VIII [Phormidesmis sp.]